MTNVYESLILGTDMSSPLELNNSSPLTLEQLSITPAKKKPRWADGRNGSVLVDEEMAYENAEIPCVVRVEPQTTMDLANAKVGLLLDMLQEAERRGQAGLPCSYTPATGSTTWTWYLLLGEITNLPVDWENGWLAKAPALTVSLTRRPFFYRPEVTVASASLALPVSTYTVDDVPGDVPAEARLVITDPGGTAQSRRFVEWGLENQYLAEEIAANGGSVPPPLIIESTDLVTSGFTGTGGTLTGAYGPSSANHVVFATALGTPTALCGFLDQKHIGTFRVRARLQAAASTLKIRLSWQDGDGPFRSNAWTGPAAANQWADVDLGLITVSKAAAGAQRWNARVEIYDSSSAPGGATLYLDFVRLMPTERYGKARAIYSYTPGVITGYDLFTGIGSGTALNGRTATAGGTWATSGAATDFSADGADREKRNATGIRFALLGSTIWTDLEIAVDRNAGGFFGNMGVVARYVDSSNYLAAFYNDDVQTFAVQKVVAGVATELAFENFVALSATTTTRTVHLIVTASGIVTASLEESGAVLFTTTVADSALATGGALDDGKVGIYHGGASGTQYFDSFVASTPAPEPIVIYSTQSCEFRSDSAIREDAGGTKYGNVPSYRGAFFYLPPAGNADRSTRIAVAARRQDSDTTVDDGITDSTTIQVFYTPRHLLPR